MFSLDDMYLFNQVVEHGSLSAASTRLDIPKSTLARRIAQLERKLGAPLFHKAGRRLVLTSFGTECLAACQGLAQEAEQLSSMVDQWHAGPSGSLHIVCLPRLGDLIIDSLAMEFARAAPQVSLHLDTSTTLLDPREISADLVIHASFGKLPNANVIARKIADAPYLLVAHPSLFATTPAPRTPETLLDHPCMSFGGKARHHTWRLRKGRESKSVRFTPRLSSSQINTLLLAARQGLGITMLPLALAHEEIQQGRLVAVLPDWRPPAAQIFAIYPKNKTLSTAARLFLNITVERLRDFLMQPEHQSL